MKRLGTITLAFGLISLMLSSCARRAETEQAKEQEGKHPAVTKGVCVVHPVGKDNKVHGLLIFTQKGEAVEITGEVTGLTPGKHGIHVHEFGDIHSEDCMSTGGHFNPTNMPHGGPDDEKRHVGDLGNLVADESGKAVIKMTDKHLKLNGPHSVVGRAIIIHAKADDLKSQPAGDAGARIGAGVIGIGKADAKHDH